VLTRTLQNRSVAALGVAAALLILLFTTPATAQFSAREGFTADGTAHWTFEVSPYLFLPNVNATIGLQHPAGFDISINQNRPTVSKVIASLNGAFVAYNLVRYGNWSAELNLLYLSVSGRKTFPPFLAGGPGATLKSTVSGFLVSPGFGYQVLPTDASSHITLDVRVGLSYNTFSASASFDRSILGGVDVTTDFLQPWIGARLSYYASPNWRVVADTKLTGLGVDGGAIGWNGSLAVSYLITTWFDVTLAYQAVQIRRNGSLGGNGQNRSLNLLAYGPVVAIGFRF
jgi:hypothetical protein